MNNVCKLLKDAKFFIALSESSAINVKRINIIDCIENGADVNVQFAYCGNNTPLHIAVMKGDTEIVKILLKHGAKANIKNDARQTALDLSQHTAITELLAANEEEPRKMDAKPKADETLPSMAVCSYKKRAGTAGVRGQLYETKLLTMIYLRALRCTQMTQFHLGTNLGDIGAMDDVCMRFKTVNTDCVLFLQAKHKEDVVKGKIRVQDLWRTSGDFSLLKYFSSYRKIRAKFSPNSDDELFRGNYKNIIPYYVIYTTIKDDIEHLQKKTAPGNIISNLVGTGDCKNVFQLTYQDQDIDLLTNALMAENIKCLGQRLFKLIQEDSYAMMLSDELIRSYHVVLAQKVLNLSDVNPDGRRKGTFREEFFTAKEEPLIILRESLYAEAAKSNKLSTKDIDVSLMRIYLRPQADSISELYGNVLMYDSSTNTLKLTKELEKESSKLKCLSLIESIQIPQTVASDALEIAGLNKLHSLTFNLPAAFGNVDMTVQKKKAAKRLQYLADKMYDVIRETADTEGNVVIREGTYAMDKHLDAGVLAINGGIAGAIGNLFVLSEDNTLKFNSDVEALRDNAKQLYLEMKDKLEDLERYRFIIEVDDFPRLAMHSTQHEKRLARDFLDNLYFYTCQAKEEQLENIVTQELHAHDCSGGLSRSESRIKSNALFLKAHNEIQNWWLMDNTTYYLTRNMPTFDKIFLDLRNNGLLEFMNFIYLNEMRNHCLEFSPEATESLSICKCDANSAQVLVINTSVSILTCHKLVQYFRDVDNCLFIDIDYVSQMSSKYLEMITAELSDTDNISVIVIICTDTTKYNIEEILRSCKAKKLILVTDNFNSTEGYFSLSDDKINLTDLTDTSQAKILQNRFVYQGIEVGFAEAFDDATKHLINSKVLRKIINNETIILGQTLKLSTYEEIKHYYIPRTLKLNEKKLCFEDSSNEENIYYLSSSSDEEDGSESPKKFLPTTLIDHHQVFKKKRTHDIILILDAPGMGKSTLLTHLSLETKKRYPKIWIQRINLIDHTKQFHEWNQNKVKLDRIEILKFVCQVVLTKSSSRNIPYLDQNIDLEIVDGEIKLVNNNEQDALVVFELNVFLHCFQRGQIIFLFDGFDEVCPHYKTQVTELLKILTFCGAVDDTPISEINQKRHVQCVWITSRPYNDLRKTLEKEFGESYTLQPFFYTEIRIFLDKYMRRNLNLNEMTSQQLQNINGFFEYMRSFDVYEGDIARDVRLVNIPLHSIYVAAMEYFKSEIKRSHVSDENLEYVNNWDIKANELFAWLKHLNNLDGLNRAITLSGVPLHVYIAIHYFQSQIKVSTLTDGVDIMKQWDLDTNAFAFYERFLETKLRNIRFEEKNQMDLYNPDVQMTYEKEKKEFVEKHKKLAFYTVCSKRFFMDSELNEIKDIIKGFEIAEDKTGIVDRIVDGEPRFVHYTFAEYFSVEYMMDSLKSDDYEEQRRMLDYVIQTMVYWGSDGILNIFDLKFKFDPDFVAAMSTPEIKRHIFETLKDQSEVKYEYYEIEDYVGDPDDLTATALDKTVKHGLMCFTEFLIDAVIDTVEESNFDTFMNLLTNGTFFKKLVASWKKELVSKLLDCIRKFNASKIDELFPYYLFEERIHSRSTGEEFIEAYHLRLIHNYHLNRKRNRHLSH